MTVFNFRLGGHIALFLEAYSGDSLTVDNATAKIRAMNHDGTEYLDDADVLPMTVVYQPAGAEQAAGWHIGLDDTPSPAFTSGFYGVDVWLKIDGEDVPSEMALIHLRKAAGP